MYCHFGIHIGEVVTHVWPYVWQSFMYAILSTQGMSTCKYGAGEYLAPDHIPNWFVCLPVSMCDIYMNMCTGPACYIPHSLVTCHNQLNTLGRYLGISPPPTTPKNRSNAQCNKKEKNILTYIITHLKYQIMEPPPQGYAVPHAVSDLDLT